MCSECSGICVGPRSKWARSPQVAGWPSPKEKLAENTEQVHEVTEGYRGEEKDVPLDARSGVHEGGQQWVRFQEYCLWNLFQ